VVGDGLPWAPADDESLRRQQVRLFISYCSRDNGAVEGLEAELARALDRRGEPHDLWRDRWRIRAGEPFQERIAEALRSADYLLVVLSEQSLGSRWVNVEWRQKYASEIDDGRVRVIPVTLGKLEPSRLPDFLQGKHAMALPLSRGKLARPCDELAGQIIELRSESASQHTQLGRPERAAEPLRV
jgi:TIR domain